MRVARYVAYCLSWSIAYTLANAYILANVYTLANTLPSIMYLYMPDDNV